MKSSLSFRQLLFIAAIAVAGAILLSLVDDNLGMAWPTNVMRNWQEFGVVRLHGQLVYNPGGFEATTHPQIYYGMSPMFMYPAYFVTQIFSWTGLDTMAFHLVLLLAVLWGSWRLLGRGDFALLVAAAAVLCPGYMRWSKILDPNGISVLPFIPYAALALAILKRPKFSPGLAAALFVLTVGFMSLNWTTAWVCAPCIFLFLGMPGLNRRALVFLIVVMVIGVPAVVATSLVVKSAGGGATGNSGMGPLQVLGGYTWANSGYGAGVTSTRDFLRLAFINGVGLFPLWLALLYAAARRLQRGAPLQRLAFAFVPLALTVADLVIMRNYFGHHPWMAGPVLLVGLIFSLALLSVPMVETGADVKKISLKSTWALAGLCGLYGFAVLAFFRANEVQLLKLTQLVRQHTARSDTIIIVKDADAATASLADRLGESLDRRVIVVGDFSDLAVEKDHWVVLSAVPLNGSLTVDAQSAPSQSPLNQITAWFNRSISKRSPGDRMDLSDTYFLYGPN